MANIKDVSRLSGVSIATVSRVVNSPHLVAPETRTKVEAAIAQTEYIPNQAARSLHRQRSNLVGVVITSFADEAAVTLLDSLSRHLDRSGFGMLAVRGAGALEGVLPALSQLRGINCCSVVLLADGLCDRQLVALMRQHPTLVLVGATVRPYRLRCVDGDLFDPGQDAAETVLTVVRTEP